MNASTLSEVASLWSRVLENLSKQINDSRIFDVFFKDTFIFSINGKDMLVACNSNLATTILNDKYKDVVTQTVDSLTGTDFDVTFANCADQSFYKVVNYHPLLPLIILLLGQVTKKLVKPALLLHLPLVNSIILYLYIVNQVWGRHIY